MLDMLKRRDCLSFFPMFCSTFFHITKIIVDRYEIIRSFLGMKATEPLLAIGIFGTHVIKNPAGSFSFTGEVPVDLKGSTYGTEDEATDAFVAWYRQTSESFQSKNCKNLRTDIFAYCLTGTKEFA